MPTPLLGSLLFMFFRLVFAVLLFFLKGFGISFKWDSMDETLISSWSKLISSSSDPSGLLKKNLKLGMKSLDMSTEWKNFDLDRVIFLLFLSALLYKRDEEQVIMAHHMLSNMKNVKHDIQKVKEVLRKSAKRICKEIEEFKLEFTSLSELNTFGGPYAGMFWSKERNFIVIAFKGTTISEWLTNAIFQHIDARSFLFGEVHDGSAAILDESCPAARIIEAVRQHVATIRKRNKENNTPINIYITGHSLGGALATLLYGYLLKFPQGLGEFCILRGGATFGSPSIVDNDFASQSVGECKTLWRVVCDSDLVSRVQYYNKYSNNQMNYGDEVRFYQDCRHPSFTSNIFGDLDENWSLIDKHGSDYDNCYHKKSEKKLPFVPKYDERLLYSYEMYLPDCFRNHSPHRYFVTMENARGLLDPC